MMQSKHIVIITKGMKNVPSHVRTVGGKVVPVHEYMAQKKDASPHIPSQSRQLDLFQGDLFAGQETQQANDLFAASQPAREMIQTESKKEPMTHEKADKAESEKGETAEIWKKTRSEHVKDRLGDNWVVGRKSKFPGRNAVTKKEYDAVEQEHSDAVERAIDEGKDVPQNVRRLHAAMNADFIGITSGKRTIYNDFHHPNHDGFNPKNHIDAAVAAKRDADAHQYKLDHLSENENVEFEEIKDKRKTYEKRLKMSRRAAVDHTNEARRLLGAERADKLIRETMYPRATR